MSAFVTEITINPVDDCIDKPTEVKLDTKDASDKDEDENDIIKALRKEWDEEDEDENDIIKALRKEWDEEDDEETKWTELWHNNVLYHVNPEETRWIRHDDMVPHLREYYPGMEKTFDYDDLSPIIDE